MKKILVAVGLIMAMSIFVSNTSQAQQWENNANHIYNTNAGFVGIHNTGALMTPNYPLDVALNMSGPSIAVRNLGGGGGAQYIMYDQVSNADWRFKSTGAGAFKIRDQISGLDVLFFEKGAAANCIYVKAGGNVGIGTANPSVKLAVNGKINCKEVEVTLTGWSDYVFKDGYNLKPLSEVEAFINDNKHLPGVPSEAEVLQKGTNLGEMDAVLLQKIEELTLYVINLKKQNDNLSAQIQDLKQK